MKRLVNNRVGVSQRKLARKFSVNQTTISRQLKKMSIQHRKCEKTPKYSAKQEEKSTVVSAKLANYLYRSSDSVIMDDEKYFTLSGHNMPGNSGYYTGNKYTVPNHVRFAGKEKFPLKVLVWIAISEKGISAPLIRPSGSVAVNSDIYIKECLEKRLLPFIHKYHPHFTYQFWPDLASAHYSNATTTWMEEFINFVPKSKNPPNVPQARPIENFWGCLCQKVYENGWEAKTQKELIARIKSKLSTFDEKFVESLMKGVKAKLKYIGQKGVFSLNK